MLECDCTLLDVAIALDYLHSHCPHIVHYNVDPASILVMCLENSESGEAMAKLGNFDGVCREAQRITIKE